MQKAGSVAFMFSYNLLKDSLLFSWCFIICKWDTVGLSSNEKPVSHSRILLPVEWLTIETMHLFSAVFEKYLRELL